MLSGMAGQPQVAIPAATVAVITDGILIMANETGAVASLLSSSVDVMTSRAGVVGQVAAAFYKTYVGEALKGK